MKIKTLSINQSSQLSHEIEMATSDGFSPNLAFMFSSVQIGLEGLIDELKELPFEIAGCSTCGEILFSNSHDGVYQYSMAATLMEINPDFFRTKIFDGNHLTSFELGQQAGIWGSQIFANPSFIILISGLNSNGQEIVEGILEITGNNTVIFGGMAGDDSAFKETFVFNSNQLLNKGLSVVVFDAAKIEISGIASSGWVGIGSDKLITNASGNVVFTIDNMPALDVYLENLNINENELPEIGVEYPLLVKRNGKEVLRAVTGVNKQDRSLIFAGTVPKGSFVSFSTSPGFEVIEHTKIEIQKFFEKNPAFDMLILFSCMARHLALGPVISDEIEAAFKKWNTPITGFFCYGEIGTNFNQQCDFYNETFTLCAIRER